MPSSKYVKHIMAAAMLLSGAVPATAQIPWPSYEYAPHPAVSGQWPSYQYPPYPSSYGYPFVPSVPVQPYVPTTPPSWSFDPYTSGLGPCPQRGPGDEPCSERISPSYGQPSYWPQ